MTGRVTKDKKTNKYYYTIDIRTKENRKRKVKKNFKTKKEAKRALELAMEELQKEERVKDSQKEGTWTLGSYFDYWLKTYAKSNTAPNTFRGYEGIIRVHLKPDLGHIKLHDLTINQIQDYYTDKLEQVSAQTVKHHHRLLCKMLNDAIDWEFLTKNVALKAKPPKPERFKPTFYSKEELNHLFEAAKASTVYHPIIFTGGHTGARLGELRALQWDDIDFHARKVSITKSAYMEKNGKTLIRDLTKGKKDRTIIFGKNLMVFLKSHFERYQEMKTLLGETFNPNNLVFFNAIGDYIKPRELHRAYKNAIKRSGLSDARFHDLRHSHATILLKKNVHPKIVSERLGHSKPSITLEIYSHATSSLQEEAAHVFDEDE
ncbi:tyrosine-type recombinase/integrase [Halalkalibacter akibai]|uniref:Integrase n=1 Tax=Halalkalibacter akibai (strain ATCC 43226 / DSM 21942 / CIP 109018 / JCM 9157 / 1139) TaxID=1236973 RepID=W4QUE1_HALA3|nr:site-specific integrase [Halalkalibacter akibai]GAE35706.1 integrase [Halalkalibacter akibai JCM 9157]